MKVVNEKLGGVNIPDDVDTSPVIKPRPGRLPRLTDIAVIAVPVEIPEEEVKEEIKYLMPNRPLTLSEIRHFLEHPEELELATDTPIEIDPIEIGPVDIRPIKAEKQK